MLFGKNTGTLTDMTKNVAEVMDWIFNLFKWPLKD